MAQVLIVGLGFLGNPLAKTLHQDGHQVYGIKRQPPSSPFPFPLYPVDIVHDSLDSLKTIPPLDTLYYLVSADQYTPSAYQNAYHHGLIHTLQALSSPPKRLIFASSSQVYQESQGEWVNEESPTSCQHFSQSALLAGESITHQYHGVVARLSGLYGPTRLPMLSRVKQTPQQSFPQDHDPLNLIHQTDAIHALIHLAKLAKPESCYNLCNSHPVQRTQWLEHLAKQQALAWHPVISESPPPSKRPRQAKKCRNTRLLTSGFEMDYPTALHPF